MITEAMYINKSLSFLEQVVLALADKHRDHVPFRQSKLTHYLQDSVGGNCNTVLIANIWGERSQLEETVSSPALSHVFPSFRLIGWVVRCSVLGPMLFTMYIKPLSAIIDSHSIIHHSFADDLQLQMYAPPDRISELLHSMQSCISDVKAWATANMLKLNDSKTELMLVTSKRSKHLHNLPTSITIGNAQIPFKQSVKNLGFTLDCHLTMICACLQYCSYMLL